MPTVIGSNGQTHSVTSGRTETNDAILGDSTMLVLAAGEADGEVVSGGSTDVGAQLPGGEQDAAGYAGGATFLGVNQGGGIDILSGGLAGGTQLYVGGLDDEKIGAGGTDLDAQIPGGAQEAFGHARGAQLSVGGEQMNPGGTASAAVVGGGELLILSDGAASGAAPFAGFEAVHGTAVSTTIDGGTEYDGGIAPGAPVDGDGRQVVELGVLTSGSLAISGGSLLAVGDPDLVHRTAPSTTIDNGGIENNWSFAGRAQIDNGGRQIVEAGALIGSDDTASGPTVARGGVDEVIGSAVRTTIDAGCIGDDWPVAAGSPVGGGGLQIVEAGGLASATEAMTGGDLFGGAAGAASGATVAGGGFDQVGTIIDSGGQQNILISITTSDTTVLSGGVEDVVADGTTLATTISGGFMEVNAGGSGGLVRLASGGTSQPDDSLHLGGFVSGPGAPDILGLADTAFASGTTLPAGTPSGTSGTFMVADGAHMAHVSQLHAGADGQGGTVVSDPPGGTIDPAPARVDPPVTQVTSPAG